MLRLPVWQAVMLALAILLVAACGNVSPAAPLEPSQSQDRAPLPEVTRDVPTPIPYQPVRIYSIVLTIGVDDDGVPVDNRDALPVNTPAAFLAVLVQDIPQGTEFDVEWLRDRGTIGWSQHLIRESVPGDTWIALRFEPDEGFTSGDYSARLSVNGNRVESLVFRVGGGRVSQPAPAPRLVFAASWNVDDATIAARTSFEYGQNHLVAILSNPPAVQGQFTSQWYFGDDLIAEIPADSSQSPTVRTFTFSAEEPLLPGSYRVSTFAGGQHQLTASLIIERPQDADARAEITDLIVTDSYEEGSGAPDGASINEFRPPVQLFAMVRVTNLWPEDVIEVQWLRGDELIATGNLSGQVLSRSWVSFTHAMPGPVTEETPHRVRALLNGELVAERALLALTQ